MLRHFPPYVRLLFPMLIFSSLLRPQSHPRNRLLRLALLLLLFFPACNSTIHTRGGWLRARRIHRCDCPSVDSVPDSTPPAFSETVPWPQSPTPGSTPPEPSLWEKPPPDIEILPPIALPPFQMLDHVHPVPSWHALVLTY